MDWLQRMNNAIGYIEDNLEGDIDFENLAKAACCSSFHFQRMFSFLTDVPLSEYIRRRRLTIAAFELQYNNVKVIDLAIKYGYDSPNSFTRAFQNLHGVTPTSARDLGVKLKAYPRMTFHISIKGDVEMNYRIEQKEAISVFGVEEIFTTENGQNLKAIPDFWLREINKGTLDRLSKAAGIECDNSYKGIKPVNSVMCYRNTGGNTFPYMICAFTPPNGVPEGFVSAKIPAMTWAIFSTEEHTEDKTSETIQALWTRICTEWFPTSGYEHVSGAEFEMYGISESGKDYCEVWIPVTKK